MRHVRLSVTLILLSLLVYKLPAQSAPPPQAYVASIGTTPFKAPATADFSPDANFTLEGWFFLTSTAPYGWLMGKGLATGGSDPYLSFGLLLNDDGTRVRFSATTGAAGSGRDVTAPTAFPLRTWTHVAAVMEGTTMRLLINGTVVSTGTAVGAPPVDIVTALGIGSAYLANGNGNYPAFPGYARQVRFWNVARSAAQITAALSESLPTARAGLVAAWPLDESSGNAGRDLSGTNRTLTGGGNWSRLSLLEAGPFYSVTSTTPAGNVLADIDDAILIDFDNDGDLDLVTQHIRWPATVPETRLRLHAFRNTNGIFTDVTDAVLGNVTMVHPRDRYVGDLNGDGRADLLIVGHGTDTPPFPGEQAKIFIQSADGRLVDESSSRLPQHNSFTHNVAVGDIDGDGDLDIYVSNINGGDVGPRFYLNNGAGFFTEVMDRLPADIAYRTGGLCYTSSRLVDCNGDGFVDLVLGGADSAATNEILINDRTGHFARDTRYVLPPKLFGVKASTVAIASADLNGDGASDLLFSTTGGTYLMPDGRTIDGYSIPGVQLLLNRGDGTFYDATTQLNLTFGAGDTWAKWIRVTDMDGDGRPDFILQGNVSRTILLNRGGAVFVDASEAYAGGSVTYLQPGDVDRDGIMDLVGVNSGAIILSRGLKPLDRAVFQTSPDSFGRLVNLSVRTQAGSGDQTLIAGFVLSGAGTKQLLVRAVGPTLASYGVTGTLVDPFLELAPLGGANLATNDNWGGTPALQTAFANVGAFDLASTSSKDAALLFAPAAGPHTVKVTGFGGATGVALVELYDSDATTSPRLVNLSARTQVGTGAEVLIAGFVVTGNVPKKFLIRAAGPTLGTYGVTGSLVDPMLTVRPLGSDSAVAVNDDWRGTAALKSAFATVGAFGFASDASKDAALAVELPPGVYTATVTGKDNSTGVALVEVYEMP